MFVCKTPVQTDSFKRDVVSKTLMWFNDNKILYQCRWFFNTLFSRSGRHTISRLSLIFNAST